MSHCRLQVLTPLLLPEECELIFGRVGLVFSKSLADSFERLLPQVRSLLQAA